MTKYTLYPPASAARFEKALKDWVKRIGDQVENCAFGVLPQTLDEPDTFNVAMWLWHLNDLVEDSPNWRRMMDNRAAALGDRLDWQPEPRQEEILRAIQCHIRELDAESLQVTITCNDERADGYCAELVAGLRRDWPEMRVLEDDEAPAERAEAAARPTESKWNNEAIRNLLSAAFNDEDLMIFCSDHFRPVYDDFASGMGKGQKIQRLLDHCVRQEQVDDLLAAACKANPMQYQRFEGQLTG